MRKYAGSILQVYAIANIDKHFVPLLEESMKWYIYRQVMTFRSRILYDINVCTPICYMLHYMITVSNVPLFHDFLREVRNVGKRVRTSWVEYACGELHRKHEEVGRPGVCADDSEGNCELHWSVLGAVKVSVFHPAGEPGVDRAGCSESKAGQGFILVVSINSVCHSVLVADGVWSSWSRNCGNAW